MVDCSVGIAGGVGNPVVECTGFWVQDTNPTMKMSTNMMLKCIDHKRACTLAWMDWAKKKEVSDCDHSLVV